MREHLINFYLDYVNNYLTVAGIAEDYGLLFNDASALVDMGRRYYEEDCDINDIIEFPMTHPEKTSKILRLLSDGLSIETVALMVGVSERLVKHIENVNNQNKKP